MALTFHSRFPRWFVSLQKWKYITSPLLLFLFKDILWEEYYSIGWNYTDKLFFWNTLTYFQLQTILFNPLIYSEDSQKLKFWIISICFKYTTFCNMECFAENINDESVFSLKPFISTILHDHHRNSRLRMQIILGDPFWGLSSRKQPPH